MQAEPEVKSQKLRERLNFFQPHRVGMMINNLQRSVVLDRLPTVNIATDDPNDTFLPTMATTSRAEYLVTGDYRTGLLRHRRIGPTRIFAPEIFCANQCLLACHALQQLEAKRLLILPLKNARYVKGIDGLMGRQQVHLGIGWTDLMESSSDTYPFIDVLSQTLTVLPSIAIKRHPVKISGFSFLQAPTRETIRLAHDDIGRNV